MKKHLLFFFGNNLFSIAAFSQANVPLMNSSLEFPSNSNKLNCNFKHLQGFGWIIDSHTNICCKLFRFIGYHLVS
jgi:hypothetical protein